MSREGLNRLIREYQMIQKDPIPFIVTVPTPNNWLIWHFVIYDLPEDSPYFGGVYHGELKFTSNYPMSPPSIIVHTPNGRFKPGERICTSMSDFHPETWSPIWRISSILSGLVSFMQSEERSTGCVASSDTYKRSCALKSLPHILSQQRLCSLFEDFIPAFRASHDRIRTSPEQPLELPSQSWAGVLVLFLAISAALVISIIK
jgi:ubiquitin-conjugating enzyme E2 J2